MADNIFVRPATEHNRLKVATDEVGSQDQAVHYPVYKLATGGDGEASLVTETNPMAVKAGAGDMTLDAWGNQKVTFPVSIFHGLWTYDVPPSMWMMYENGTQVYTSTDITSSGGVLKMLTTASNTALITESRECPRYQPNRGHVISMAGWFPNKTNDGVRDFGLFTTENGVFFRLKSDGLLYAVLRRGSSEVKEELIDTSGITGFDVEKNNIYDIQFQWRAAGNYKFFIGDPSTGTIKLVHTFDNLGTLTTASIENPALPIAFKATRTTENVEMNIGCADISSEGGERDNFEQYTSFYAEAVAVGTDQPVIVVRSPLQINSETNTRTCTLARVTVTCTKKAVFKIWSTRSAADITGATYQARGNGTYLESDSTDMDATAVRATSVTVANLNFITAVPVPQNIRTAVTNPYEGRIEFPFVRGDYLVVTCTAATAEADAVVEFGEQI